MKQNRFVAAGVAMSMLPSLPAYAHGDAMLVAMGIPLATLVVGFVAGVVTRHLRWPVWGGVFVAMAPLTLLAFLAGVSEQGIEVGLLLAFFTAVFGFLPVAGAFGLGVWIVDRVTGDRRPRTGSGE